MVALNRIRWPSPAYLAINLVLVFGLFGGIARASVGDKLPEFRECVEVRGTMALRLDQAGGDEPGAKSGGLTVVDRTADMQA